MSEVLHAISRSKFELSAVLESVAEAAARLCRADGAVIFQLDGGLYRFAAGYSLVPAYLEIERQSIIAPGPGTVVGRAAITRQVIRIDDLLSDPLYEQKEESKVEGNRSMIGVPLMRDGEPVVVIGARPPPHRSVRRPRNRTGDDVRRAGHDRHRECAAVE